MKKILKSVLRLLAQMAIVTALLVIFQVVTDGMWFFGLPELDGVDLSALPTRRSQTK